MQLHEKPRSEASLSDEWETPNDTFLNILNEFKLNTPLLDVTANSNNTKCSFYMSKIQNSLQKDWILENSVSTVDNYKKIINFNDPYCRWINPPNKYTQEYIKRSNEQFYKDNRSNIMLIPINATVTKAGKKYIWDDPNVEIHPVLPTPKFIYNGKQMDSARNRYCCVIWRRKND